MAFHAYLTVRVSHFNEFVVVNQSVNFNMKFRIT